MTGSSDARIDWASLGLPDWLTDRVERLSFRFPTGAHLTMCPRIQAWGSVRAAVTPKGCGVAHRPHGAPKLLLPCMWAHRAAGLLQGPAALGAHRAVCACVLRVCCAEVQRRAAPAVLSELDVVIKAETGSGKTLSYLAPALAKLQYPPELYPSDLNGPQVSLRLQEPACSWLSKHMLRVA